MCWCKVGHTLKVDPKKSGDKGWNYVEIFDVVLFYIILSLFSYPKKKLLSLILARNKTVAMSISEVLHSYNAH